MDNEKILEELSAIEHERWSGWMEYQAKHCKLIGIPGLDTHRSGELFVDRWTRQANTNYEDLTEVEKESDRIEARKGLAVMNHELDRLREEKDGAYGERDRLVAALSKVFPSHLCRHPDEDTEWDTDWRWIVCIHLPTGQATWHIHDSERHQFNHLSVSANHWDGHTTEEKYRRLDSLPESEAEVDRLRARVVRLEGVLREVEWLEPEPTPRAEPYCLWCGAVCDTHYPDCALDAALRDGE